MNRATAEDRAHQFTVYDPVLAAALRAVGVPEANSRSKIIIPSGDATGARFSFLGRSECGRYSTKHLVGFYRQGVEFIRENPEHPFAYAMAAAMNLSHLWEQAETSKRKIVVRQGKSFLTFDEDLAPRLQDKLLQKGGL